MMMSIKMMMTMMKITMMMIFKRGGRRRVEHFPIFRYWLPWASMFKSPLNRPLTTPETLAFKKRSHCDHGEMVAVIMVGMVLVLPIFIWFISGDVNVTVRPFKVHFVWKI